MSCDRPTQRVCNGALPRHAIHRLLTRAAGAFLSHRRLQSSRMTIAGTTASIYTNPPCPIARKTLDTARWEHGKDRWMGDVEFGRTRRFGPAFGPCMAESPGVLSPDRWHFSPSGGSVAEEAGINNGLPQQRRCRMSRCYAIDPDLTPQHRALRSSPNFVRSPPNSQAAERARHTMKGAGTKAPAPEALHALPP